MKKYILLLTIINTFFLSSCEKENVSKPPLASLKKVTNIIIADQTSAKFESTSSGEIDSYSWEFENGLGFSGSENPSYVFEYEGAREVNLTVEGPGGSASEKISVVVYAFDPNCSNLNNISTHLTSKINQLRSNNLIKGGFVKIKNNYNVTIDLLLYSPNDWLSGEYLPKYTYSLPSGAEGVLNVAGSEFQYSNEWGIRVQGTSGVISCIRTLGAVAEFDGSQYDVLASDILDGI